MGPGPWDQRLMQFVLEMRQAGVTDPNVLSAMELTPRAAFAPAHFQGLALEDRALPLGCGQQMSAPSLVGRTLNAAQLQPGQAVLEVGTGSGYQAAVTARLVGRVISIERHAGLVSAARAACGLNRLEGVFVQFADGGQGWPAGAPYDRILVNAVLADGAVLERLLGQLAPDGLLLAGRMTDRGARLQLMRAGTGWEDLGPAALAALSESPLASGQDCSPP